MSSNRKRSSLRKAHEEIAGLRTQLALIEHHYDVLKPFAEGAAALADAKDARIQELLGILKAVEWGGGSFDRHGDFAPFCPMCEELKVDGHAEGCQLGQALTGFKAQPSGD